MMWVNTNSRHTVRCPRLYMLDLNITNITNPLPKTHTSHAV